MTFCEKIFSMFGFRITNPKNILPNGQENIQQIAITNEQIIELVLEQPEETMKKVDEATLQFKEAAQHIAKQSQEAAEQVADQSKQAAEQVAEKVKEAAEQVAAKVKEAADKAKDAADQSKQAAEQVAKKVKEAADHVAKKVREAAEKVAEKAKEATKKAKKAAEKAKAAAEQAQEAADQVAEQVKEVAEQAKKAADQVATKVQEAAEQAHEAAEEADAAAEQVKEAADQVAEQVQEAADQVAEQVREAAEQVAEKVKDAADKAADAAEKAKEAAWEVAAQAKEAAKQVAQKVKEAAKQIAEKVKEAAEKAQDAAEKVAAQVKDASDQAEEAKHAAERAEQANLFKSQFLANMSHELRTPLNPILGFTELLSKATNLTDEQRRWLKIVNQRGQDLLAMIGDVLDLSKIEANKVVIDRKPLLLRQTVKEILDSVSLLATKKGIRLEYQVTENLPNDILADGYRLRQVLLNLLNNALKFTEYGSIEIQVTHENTTEPTRELRSDEISLLFSIKDTGIGIAKEQQALIFEAFVCANEKQMVKYGGTGLGLAISQRLVNKMGGHIWINSEIGQGSTFFFTIIVGKSLAATHNAENLELTLNAEAASSLRILVVDDDPCSLLLAELLMIDAGYTVKTARNGLEALATIDTEEPFDVVLMDIRMPEMGGIEATHAIRKRDERIGRHTFIVALTASALESDKSRFMNAGMDEYLTKPINMDKLLALISSYKNT